MTITITDMHLCAGGNHVIFTAVDKNGKDVSFSKDLAEVKREAPIVETKSNIEIKLDEIKELIASANAKTLEEMKQVVLGGKI